MKKVLALLAMVVVLGGCSHEILITNVGERFGELTKNGTSNGYVRDLVLLKTSKGEIKIKVYPENSPIASRNFVKNAQRGKYNGARFHNVNEVMVLGGDKLGGLGGGRMLSEINSRPFVVGSVGAWRGANIDTSNDVQFFICKADCDQFTNFYVNFGEVTEGMGVVRSLEAGDRIETVTVF